LHCGRLVVPEGAGRARSACVMRGMIVTMPASGSAYGDETRFVAAAALRRWLITASRSAHG
jgi:hypothetical protein